MDTPDAIGHYRIGPKLGQGGMGEVYRATDTRLGRDVAIKRLTPALAHDATRMANLTREAQVLASLNHPNIASIYGIEDEAIVMELVEGTTLAERLQQGPIPLDEALPIARQVADGLAAAHDKGIVHRDLKPGNIKITPDGTVKLLDFGLAKAAATASLTSDDAVTVALSMASSGMIVGTPGYMAPEQARGLAVDKRVDIWAFGVVLYEMLTGATLFRGDTTADVMAAVVREEPDLTRMPARVRPLLRRCLEKDPRKRLRDIGDAALLLETAADQAAPPPAAAGRRSWLPWALAAALAAVVVAMAVMRARETAPAPDLVRFKVTLPAGVTLAQFAPFVVSPNGRMFVFPAVGDEGRPRLWLQPIDALEPRPLANAETTINPNVLTWSNDSASIIFADGTGALKRIDLTGGPAETILRLEGNVLGAALTPDGAVLHGAPKGVMRVPPGGGAPAAIVETDGPSLLLDVLPDGRHFLYTRSAPAGERAVYVGDSGAAPGQQSNAPLLSTDLGAQYVSASHSPAGGYLLFPRGGALMAQPFDAGTRRLSGTPRVVAENVFAVNNQAGFGGAFYSASQQGTLAYRSGTAAERLARQLAWFERDGRQSKTFAELGRYNQVKLSPDGTRVVTSRTELDTGSNADLWVTDLLSETSTRFTFGGGGPNVQPVWSRDGQFIAWVRSIKGVASIFRRRADGAGAEELLYRYPDGVVTNMSDWSADGRFLIYTRAGDIVALPVGPGTDTSRQPVPLVESPATEFGAIVSNDGRWLAYISNESGQQEIFVQPFAEDGRAAGVVVGGGKWMVSRGTLGMARWRRDGRELIFLDGNGALTSVDVETTPAFRASAPRELFRLPRPVLIQAGNPGALGDATRDLERFLLAVPSAESARQEVTVVLNWDQELN
jgi:Tol biopolymer transport system component/tRNA A-37 threonylcarbamoyl transferase component Bud32